MAISKNTQANIDDSDPSAYPNGQVKDDDGTGDGFPLIRVTTSDIYEFFDKLMRLAAITFNGSFDNENNGYQFVSALIALASKSDYILPLTTVSTILQVPTNLDILQTNEKLIVQAAADWTVETQIKGSTATLLTVTITRQYKAGDYLLMRHTGGGVTLVCIITADNLNLVVSENNYLKAASNVETLAGALATKAVTPASFLSALTLLLTNATDAAPFYATDSTPGLMSAADKTTLDNVSNPVKNVGWFSGVDAGGGTVGAFAPRSGDITTAQISAVSGTGLWTQYTVQFANAMDMSTGHGYFVRFSVVSEGTIVNDMNIQTPLCAIVDSTHFTFGIAQSSVGGVQNLKINCEVVQL